ncbi:hypothetical protein ACFWZ2_00680 [Streptomyces sp. NPDC059002]|uniref:hypothetical protein n=1 Tax=Streptomyces sp. NPDC059002 TaxID=3346690 RepID=UPI0036AA89BC
MRTRTRLIPLALSAALLGGATAAASTASAGAVTGKAGGTTAAAAEPVSVYSFTPGEKAGNRKQPTLLKTAQDAEGKSAAAPEKCPIEAYGHKGWTFCDTPGFAYNWGGGNIEYFVVGTNYAVYHIWKGASDWKSLGGKVSSTRIGVWDAQDVVGQVGAAVYGTDNRCWWRPRGNGSWPGTWRRC